MNQSIRLGGQRTSFLFKISLSTSVCVPPLLFWQTPVSTPFIGCWRKICFHYSPVFTGCSLCCTRKTKDYQHRARVRKQKLAQEKSNWLKPKKSTTFRIHCDSIITRTLRGFQIFSQYNVCENVSRWLRYTQCKLWKSYSLCIS